MKEKLYYSIKKKKKQKKKNTHTSKLLSMIRKNWNFWDKSLQAVGILSKS